MTPIKWNELDVGTGFVFLQTTSNKLYNRKCIKISHTQYIRISDGKLFTIINVDVIVTPVSIGD